MPTLSIGDRLAQICEVYREVRPVMATILRIPFVPRKWKDVLRTFMEVLDEFCPVLYTRNQ